MNSPIRRILLVEHAVEDAVLITTMVEDLIGDHGVVRHVQSLDQAVRTLGDEAFDVVLLDIALPDSEGTQSVLHLARVDATVPIVVLTNPETKPRPSKRCSWVPKTSW